jgi:hypothetical protein
MGALSLAGQPPAPLSSNPYAQCTDSDTSALPVRLSSSPNAPKKLEKGRKESLGVFDDGAVHRVGDVEQLRARDALVDDAGHGGRRAGILLADHDERRTADAADALRQVDEARMAAA